MAAIMTSQTSFTSCMHNQMLESNRDDVKLEAMRCVTVMTAKGKLSVPRTLFPHIVKNVSSKNPELRKLIYLYLTNFADQEPDMALLPVATLQKSLKSPNPLVRSSALKVLTSMRLSILSTILMATLRNSVNDLSPYVRKTVAHAIIKINRLDPSLREDLIEYIERLFNDKNSIVLSSAVASFEAVCPERLELVHKYYRRFCFTLADCNEWGQTIMLNLLKRYVLKIYEQAKKGELTDYNPNEHDPKILLRSAKPLVHSNNSAVVMAVVKLFITIASYNELRSTITRPLLRLLHTHREIQLAVLNMIEELTAMGEDNCEQTEPDSDEESTSQYSNSKDNNTERSFMRHERGESESQHFNHHGNEEEYLITQQVTKDGYIPFGHENDTRPYSPSTDDNYRSESDYQCKNELEKPKNNQTDYEKAGITKIKEEITSDAEKELGKEGEEGDEETEEEEEGTDDEEEEDDEEETDEQDEDEDEETETEEESESETDNVKGVQIINGESDKGVEVKKSIDFNFVDIESNKDSNSFREVFRPYIKSFFVKNTDCTQIRLAKLKILTNLSSSVNVNLVLRELQAYIATYVSDKEFVSASIHAMGRCAIIVKEVAHICLNGLTSLLSNNNEHIVSEAIVVLRSQIINKKPTNAINNRISDTETTSEEGKQLNEKLIREIDEGPNNNHYNNNILKSQVDDENSKIVSTVIKQVTKLLPTVTAPQARATILWILAEFCDKNITAAKCAPNVLRSIAKSFSQEDNFVKLQSLTLASKFLLSLDKEKKAELYQKVFLLTGYLFSLAKYDTNHDVRDRGRFLKKLLEDEKICSKVLLSSSSGIC